MFSNRALGIEVFDINNRSAQQAHAGIFASNANFDKSTAEIAGATNISAKTTNSIHILCVDDEPDILSVAKLALEMVGNYRVSTCSAGTEAIERLPELKPDLILMDVMMPQMGGPATLKKLRTIQQFENIPVVFMTARIQPTEVQEYLELGACAVVHKPFDPMQLSEQIATVLRRLKN